MERNGACLWKLLPILLLTTAGISQEVPKDKKDQPDAAVVKKLVEQLKSGDFRTRDKAAQQLSKLDEIPDALREAEKSSELEVRRRAQLIIAGITARMEDKAFQAMVADLHKIEVDRFVRRMVTDEKFAGDKEWKVIAALAKTVTKRANDLGGRAYPVPEVDMKSLPLADLAVERIGFRGKRLLVNGYAGSITGVDDAVVLCTGTMPRVTSITNSIIIVDGDVIGATSMSNCLLIVSGKIGRFTSVRGSIILSPGEFGVREWFGNNELRGSTGCDDSFLQVKNEKIIFTVANECVLIKTILLAGQTTSRVLDTDKGPLQLLKFSTPKIVSDDKLVWGNESGGLAVAIAPAHRPDSYVIRWKNVGKETLELQVDRAHFSEFLGRNDLLGHVLVRGSDGKVLPACKSMFLRGGAPHRPNTVFLEPGKTLDETINLMDFVVGPATKGDFQLSIELDLPKSSALARKGARYWTGKVRSNEVEITFGK